MKYKITTLYFFSITLLSVVSCKKFVTVAPPETALTSGLVFTDDKTASAAIAGIYSRMLQGDNTFSGQRSISMSAALAADEFTDNYDDEAQTQFYRNELLPPNYGVKVFWSEPYSYIYSVNSILEGLSKSGSLTAAVKDQLAGEAKFIRALCYFYLVNQFGDVPLALTSDYRVNAKLTRTAQATVNEQIVADLADAQTLMSETYPTAGRIRPNRSTATALLARVYLYLKRWDKAEAEATKIISNPVYVLDNNLDNVFANSSVEAIWQLRPVIPGWGVFEAYYMNITASSGPRYVSVTNSLLNTFEAPDARKNKWMNAVVYNGQTYYRAYKYRQRFTNNATDVPNEFMVVFRLAEQYLIRAEARLKQGKLTGANSAESDINIIRARAGLANTGASTEAALMNAVMQERRTELFAEFGHRWFDLKRWNLSTTVLGAVKPNWQPTDTLCPVPQDELRVNPFIDQNAGY